MRFAVLSDVHANLHALQAVWEDLEKQRPDAVYCLGDLVGYGAYPNEVIGFLRERDIPTLMGNYDDGVGFDKDDCGCAYHDSKEERLGKLSLTWSRERTTEANKAYLRKLPTQIRLEGKDPSVLMVHGSPRRVNEYLYEDRPKSTYERLSKLAGTDVVLFGHTHLPYMKMLAGTLFVNVGSVGKPKDGDPRAGYTMLTLEHSPSVEFRRVVYDVAGAAKAVRESGLPHYYASILETGGKDYTGGKRPAKGGLRK